MSWLLWLAVARADDPPAGSPPDVTVRAWVEGDVDAHGANLLVQVESPADVAPELSLPEVPETTLTASATPTTEAILGRRITTFRFRLDAPQGRHAIGPFSVRASSEQPAFQADSTLVYVDVGVEPLELGDLADIAEPAPVWSFPMVTTLTVLGLAGIAGLGVAYAIRRAPPTKLADVEAEPPDIVALRAWKAVRHDPSRDDGEKVLALSRIFREYTETVLHFPASKWTTTETLAHLVAMPHLEEGNVPRARRLLRATDLVKYAEEAPGVDLFEELDADLCGFIRSTRPMRWTAT